MPRVSIALRLRMQLTPSLHTIKTTRPIYLAIPKKRNTRLHLAGLHFACSSQYKSVSSRCRVVETHTRWHESTRLSRAPMLSDRDSRPSSNPRFDIRGWALVRLSGNPPRCSSKLSLGKYTATRHPSYLNRMDSTSYGLVILFGGVANIKIAWGYRQPPCDSRIPTSLLLYSRFLSSTKH